MSYNGQEAYIPLGLGGLLTDDSQNTIPISRLIGATNVIIRRGVIEKAPGSRRWNITPFSSGIAGLIDWQPDSLRQRFIVVTKDGKVWRYDDPETRTEITPSGSAPASLILSDHLTLLPCGAEASGRARKLFIFTGSSPVQVISGDSLTRSNLSSPAADWTTGAHPRSAVLHRGRIVAFGNTSDPHRAYFSDDDDHEQFASGGAQFSVFPGDGERLIGGLVFNGRLFLFKEPRGLFYIDDSNATITNWTCHKQSDDFGLASPNALIRVQNDVLFKNETGAILSLAATDQFGDVRSADILSRLRISEFIQQQTTRVGTAKTHATYYSDQQIAFFTYQSTAAVTPNRILALDVGREGSPQITWWTKDMPNCLALRRDSLGVPRPFYGAEDGYIYEMDRPDRDVGGSAFQGDFQTPHMDFGWLDPRIAERQKLFDFLSVTFEETGNWDLSVDVYVDEQFVETITFKMTQDDYLGSAPLGTTEAIGRRAQSERAPLHGAGKRLSLRCRNAGLRQTFRIAGLTVGFRVAGHEERD